MTATRTIEDYVNLERCVDALEDELAKLRKDAARYRWLRGGPEVPQHSTRWSRWEVRSWDGRYWQTLFSDKLDSEIDAAIFHETPNAALRGDSGLIAGVPLESTVMQEDCK